jgi:PAS domain S-box-containing protein
MTEDNAMSGIKSSKKVLKEEIIQAINQKNHSKADPEDNNGISSLKYRTVFENTGTATIIIEADYTISLINRKAEKLSGYTRKEVEGKKKWTGFVVDEELDMLKRYHRLRRENGEEAPKQYETKFVDRDGGIHDILLTIDIIPGTGQSVASLLDITKRKEIERQLKESMKRYRGFFKTSRDCVFISSEEGRWIDMNAAAVELFGYDSRAELEKTRIPELYANPEDRQKFINKIKEKGYLRDYPVNLKKKNGEIINALITSVVNKDESGNIIGFQGTIKDITDRKESEREKNKLHKQLLQAQKLESIGTLAGGVAHDFNNILTVIMGLTQIVMNQTKKSNRNYNHLKNIYESGERAARLTNQLLLFSRKQEMEFQPLNINKTITRFDKMLNRLIGEDITIKNELDNDLWKINADETQIEQVITNLAVNARDAMPNGGRLIIGTKNVIIDKNRANSIPDLDPGEYVQISVEDTGKGIEKEILNKIFDPFFTTKGKSEGTGMGLSVVHGIIKEHNGQINVYSEPGEGTIFKIYLPAVQKQGTVIKKNATAEKIDQFIGQGETILIVEDEKQVLTFLENMLDKYKYDYYSANNGEKALELFKDQKKQIDLLISDVVMTGIDGIVLADQLKKQKADLKVILSSGYSNKKVLPGEIRKKGYQFVQKPYDSIELLKKIRNILD